MNHLEDLIGQYYEWRGYIVLKNIMVGKLKHGGWEGELDIVAYNPKSQDLLHIEPSTDAHSWEKREERFKKKFTCGRKYIKKVVFPWIDKDLPLRQIAVLASSGRKELGGGEVISIDEMAAKIRNCIGKKGKMLKYAIPQKYDLLRTIQLVENGFSKVIK